MTWDDWSDKEIGLAVAAVIKDVKGWVIAKGGSELYNLSPDGMSYCSVKVVDINNPADMWPIIVENKISIEYLQDGKWGATIGNYCHIDKFNNPLRAAAIVFLMMKGVKPDERI